MAQPTRPIIGINADFLAATKQSSAYLNLHAGYADAVLEAGGLPIVMPPYNKEAEIDTFLDRVDGFILTGGLDMDPRRSGQPRHHAVVAMPERRENNDRMLVRNLLKRGLPLLAIGVGLQQVNIALDGTLFLHLPDDKPRALPHHDRCQDGPHRHLVLLEENSQMEEIYGEGELLVNSDHHQAVDAVGRNMRICAKAPDGVIEALESTDPNWFFLGVQWHPETESASALDMQMFECFIQATIRHADVLPVAA